jgi:putative endopeptidase
METMSSLVCRVAVFAISIVIAQNIATGQPAGSSAAGGWGFDLAGADFKNIPGEDFFRHANGAWYDRAVIPADRSSIGVDTALNITAEARIREILERGEKGVGPSARTDASKVGAFYAAFMDEARAEALDAEPIAPLLQMVRVAASREELAELMGTGRPSFFSSIFSVGINPDDKAPDRYMVSIGQGGLGLNRDYYVTPRLAEKKAAYLAYIAQLLAMIGWEAPDQSAAAILDFETAIAKVSWSNAERRDPEKTYNPMSVGALDEAAPFPWRRFLASADLSGLDHVVVEENTAIPKIAALYARASLDTLKAWQAFHLVDDAAPYLSKRFVAANFNFHSRTMRGVAEQPERWKRAVATVNRAMGQAIGRVYVARYFSPQAKSADRRVGRVPAACAQRAHCAACLDGPGNQAQGLGQARAPPLQTRLPGEVARLFGPGRAARRPLRGCAGRPKVCLAAPGQPVEFAGRPRRLVHESADGECQLQCHPERDGLSRRNTPAAFLRSSGRSGR